jgi:type VI secretion system FHA domain protein
MLLVLRVVGWPEGVAATPLLAHFDVAGGLIGRSETAKLSLPDPKRTVSRFHAHISCVDDVFHIEDMGSTNPPSVNGVVLGANQRSPLKAGDQIRIGDFTLTVELQRDEDARTALLSRAGPGWGNEDEAHTQIIDPDSEELPLTGADSLVRGSTMPQSPSMFARDLGRELPATPPPTIHAPLSTSARPASMPPASIPPASEFAHTEFAPRQMPTLLPASPDELWQAFEAGAQVHVDLPNGLRPELMRTIGSMWRTVIVGVRRLVLLRAQAKAEVEADVTMLRSRGNNPLKFASDETRALTALLRPPPAGFLPGPAAVEDAMADLESHQAATLVAMRAAVDAVLQRFDPQTLERRQLGGLSSLLPMGRKSQLWDNYVALYRSIGTEGRGSLAETFDRAFAAAYDAEVARIERERKRRAG